MSQIKFIHTNIVARNWKKLAQFYMDVFECRPVFPERALQGDWIDRITNIPGVRINGIHLELPGYENGPTLEIFEYNSFRESDHESLVNDQGIRHLAFHVDDVKKTLDTLIDHGGTQYGEFIEKTITGLGTVEVVYAKDIEGNIVEIQKRKGNA